MRWEEIKMPKNSEARLKANAKYQKKTYDLISISSKRVDRLRELIALGAEKTTLSKNEYMINAIRSQLSRDKITIDMLPPDETYTPPVETKHPKQCTVYMVTQQYILEDIEVEGNIGTYEEEEEYVIVTPTVTVAKNYIKKRYNSKPYVDEWIYRIYERSIEAFTKVEAVNKYRDMVKEAIEEANTIMEDDDADYTDFLMILEERYGKPDSVEVVRFEDVKD